MNTNNFQPKIEDWANWLILNPGNHTIWDYLYALVPGFTKLSEETQLCEVGEYARRIPLLHLALEEKGTALSRVGRAIRRQRFGKTYFKAPSSPEDRADAIATLSDQAEKIGIKEGHIIKRVENLKEKGVLESEFSATNLLRSAFRRVKRLAEK